MNYTQKDIEKVSQKYHLTDRRIWFAVFDCDALFSRGFGDVMPSKKVLAKVVEMPFTQMDLVRIYCCDRLPSDLRDRCKLLIQKFDSVDGLDTDFTRKRIPQPSFIEKCWREGINK